MCHVLKMKCKIVVKGGKRVFFPGKGRKHLVVPVSYSR